MKRLLKLLVVGALAAGGIHLYQTATAGASAAVPQGVAAKAMTFAEHQLGKPYRWGATGPDAFDCSGLAMMAYRAAGVSIARTSQQQWATEPHVSTPKPGDLAFFAGADGTMTSPGHVGLVVGHGQMVEAYATGFPIRVASYSRPDLVGFTNPAVAAGA